MSTLLPIIITDTGKADAIAQDGLGLQLAITAVALGNGDWTPDSSASSLNNELKRLTDFGATELAPGRIHVTIRDDSSDTYDLREIGLIDENGNLFAIYVQSEPIVTKTTNGKILLTITIPLTTVPPASVTITGSEFDYNPASPEVMGVVELATQTEMNTETDLLRVPPVSVVADYFLKRLNDFGLGLNYNNSSPVIADCDEMTVTAGRTDANTLNSPGNYYAVLNLQYSGSTGAQLAIGIGDGKLKRRGNPGASGWTAWSPVDAGTLDGLESTQFLRSDQDDTVQGKLTVERNGTDTITVKRTALNEYAGLTISDENNKPRWLLYMSTDSTGNKLILQGRRADGAYQWTAFDVNNDTGTVRFIEASPEMPTPAAGDNSTRGATTAFVKTALENLIDAAPGAMDTLNEIAAALGDDPNFATTITNLVATKVAIADVINSLGSTATDKPLAASRGKYLYDLIQGLSPGDVGAAPAIHFHSAGDITSGILPVEHGGTGVSTSTGSGSAVRNNAPSLTNPIVNTQASGDASGKAASTQFVKNTGLGWGQSWQDVLSSRSANVTYTNTTGKPIMVSIYKFEGTYASFFVDGIVVARTDNASGIGSSLSAIIPNGSTYMYEATATVWTELR